MNKNEFKNMPQKIWKRKNVLSILPLSSSIRPISTRNENLQNLANQKFYGDILRMQDSTQDILL
jgi:hypothetical protein